MSEEGKVSIFPVRCNICQREIVEEMIYYHHPKHGYVCEYCPQFEDGGLEPMDPDEGDE